MNSFKTLSKALLAICLLGGTFAQAEELPLLFKSIEGIAKAARAKIPTQNGVLVLDLQDLDGRVPYFNRYLTDQMTIALSNMVDVKVVDRQTLKTILTENKMTEMGLVDETTAINIGKVVGAKTVIYGTATDLAKVIGINMKVIDIEKGIVVGGVAKEIKKTREIALRIDAINKKEWESRNSTADGLRVVEIQMEQAVKERMKMVAKNQQVTLEANNVPDSASKAAEPSVWDKLQQSVDFE